MIGPSFRPLYSNHYYRDLLLPYKLPSNSETVVAIEQFLHNDFHAGEVIHQISLATGNEFYLFGGLIRRYIAERVLVLNDLDILVTSETLQDRIFERFDRLGVPFEANSQGHRRYRWGFENDLQIDISHKDHLFGSHDSIESALKNFDLHINATAINFQNRSFIDPLNGAELLRKGGLGINKERWQRASDLELLVLAVRLARIVFNIHRLWFSQSESNFLSDEILPRISGMKWQDTMSARYSLGKEHFRSTMERLIERRTRPDNMTSCDFEHTLDCKRRVLQYLTIAC